MSILSYLPDLSTDLTILRNETFDLTGIKVIEYGLDSSSVEKTNDQESYSRTHTEIHGVEGNNEPMAVQLQEDAEVQPTEVPVLSESHQSKVNLGSHDIDAHGHTSIISHVEELDSSQNVELNNLRANIAVSEAENCSVGPGHESSSLTEVFENDFAASLALMDKTNDLVDSIHSNILSIPNAENLNTIPILEDDFVEDQSDRNGVGAIKCSMETGTQVQTDGVDANDLYTSLATGSTETDEFTNIQASFNGDLPLEENGNSLLGQLNEDQIVASGMDCDDKDARPDCIFIENAKVDCLQSEALGLDEKESLLKDEEIPVCQEAELQSTMCPEIRSPLVDQNDVSSLVCLKLDVSFHIFYLLDLSLFLLLDSFNISDIPDKRIIIGRNMFLFQDFFFN